MSAPVFQPDLSREEHHLIALLRQGPQSVAGLAKALQTSFSHIDDVLQGLRKVGLVRLFRYDTLRYGLTE
jgi:predicted transcriptional regulator